MSEMILPGVYINVHPEGLIAPGQITIGNLGVVGTAAKGPIDTPVLLGSMDDARQAFYDYDPWLNAQGATHVGDALTLVRALEQAFAFGATTVYAVRVSAKDQNGNPAATAATLTVKAQAAGQLLLTANEAGSWGNHLSVDVQVLTGQEPFVNGEKLSLSGPGAFKLQRPIDTKSARNSVTIDNQGVITTLKIVPTAPKPGEVQFAAGKLSFPAPVPASPAVVNASYMATGDAQQVTIHFDRASEVYVVADAADLAAQVLNNSSWVTAPPTGVPVKPLLPVSTQNPAKFAGGKDGAAQADYGSGLDQLLAVDAHIIVAAGQDNEKIGAALERHCAVASTDALKRERIAVVGSALIDPNQPDNPRPAAMQQFFDKLIGHNLASDRVIFVGPGIRAVDSASADAQEVTLPGAYAAAAVAGLISSFDPEVSPTNKEVAVDELEVHFDATHLTQMVQQRILALEARSGFRIVKGITTDSGAFRQITTRRIVDYAKYGVRSAAEPYIGLLNNERVRGALRATLNSFLTDMVNAEMLEGYDLDVSATRDEEIQGIARVTMSLQPVFSIDFIVVDMFLG